MVSPAPRNASQYSSIEPSPEPRTPREEEIQPLEFSSRFQDDPSGNIQNTSNLHDAQLGEEPSSVCTDPLQNLSIEPSLNPTVPLSPPDPLNEPFLEVIKDEWMDRAGCFSEDVWTSIPSMIIPCSIGGITVEAHVNPIMEVNIMPWHLAYTFLGDVMLRPSNKLFKSCPFEHILECRGVASVVSLTQFTSPLQYILS